MADEAVGISTNVMTALARFARCRWRLRRRWDSPDAGSPHLQIIADFEWTPRSTMASQWRAIRTGCLDIAGLTIRWVELNNEALTFAIGFWKVEVLLNTGIDAGTAGAATPGRVLPSFCTTRPDLQNSSCRQRLSLLALGSCCSDRNVAPR